MKYKIFLLLAVVSIFTTSLDSKEYQILCTPILDNERICFIEGTSDGRIRFNIPCDCDCSSSETQPKEIKQEKEKQNINLIEAKARG